MLPGKDFSQYERLIWNDRSRPFAFIRIESQHSIETNQNPTFYKFVHERSFCSWSLSSNNIVGQHRYSAHRIRYEMNFIYNNVQLSIFKWLSFNILLSCHLGDIFVSFIVSSLFRCFVSIHTHKKRYGFSFYLVLFMFKPSTSLCTFKAKCIDCSIHPQR